MLIWIKRLYWKLARRACTWCGSSYRGSCTHLSRLEAYQLATALREPLPVRPVPTSYRCPQCGELHVTGYRCWRSYGDDLEGM